MGQLPSNDLPWNPTAEGSRRERGSAQRPGSPRPGMPNAHTVAELLNHRVGRSEPSRPARPASQQAAGSQSASGSRYSEEAFRQIVTAPMPRPTGITFGRGWWGFCFTLVVGLGVASSLGYFGQNSSSPDSPFDKGAKPASESAKPLPAKSTTTLDWAAAGGIIHHTANPVVRGGNADCAGQVSACLPTSNAPAPISAVSPAMAPARETPSASLADQGGGEMLGSAAQQYSGHLPFQRDLAPYGTWIEVKGYGQCWRPTALAINPDWRPYLHDGHWCYTDQGWYWQSGYSWGAITFHYGRWLREPGIGWCWWPDTVWAPSWVTWRYDREYCGWAPLPPHTYWRANVGLTFHDHPVSPGFAFNLTADHYSFVSWQGLQAREPGRYLASPAKVQPVFSSSTATTRFAGVGDALVSNHGIPVAEVVRLTGSKIHASAPWSAASNNTSQPTRGPGLPLAAASDPHNAVVPSAPSASVAGNSVWKAKVAPPAALGTDHFERRTSGVQVSSSGKTPPVWAARPRQESESERDTIPSRSAAFAAQPRTPAFTPSAIPQPRSPASQTSTLSSRANRSYSTLSNQARSPQVISTRPTGMSFSQSAYPNHGPQSVSRGSSPGGFGRGTRR